MTILLYTENQDLSSAKEVFFIINSGKKLARVIGIVIAALLGLLFLVMIVTSAAFGSAGTVNLLGFNLFICDSSDYASVPEGSAVISTSCAPYDLEEGNLVLYSTDPEDKSAPLAMGYYADFKLTDGVYYLHLVNDQDSTVISEDALIGRAGWCSPFLGAFVRFTRTPWGVIIMAVIPCALLILFDVFRVKTYEKPVPEVVPQVKNPEYAPRQPQITVGESGSAAYKRNPVSKPASSAESVLFTFDSARRGHQETKPASAPTMSDADVLSLLNAPSRKLEKPAEQEKKPVPPLFNAPAEKPASKPAPLPAPVAAKRYLDNTVSPSVKPAEKAERNENPEPAVSGSTAEMPAIKKPAKKNPDAFFTQSEAPQIGRGLTGKQSQRFPARSIIDLEDALAAAPSRPARTETRRSADILASKKRSDLITDDDDTRDKSRYEVDDILAGIEKQHHQQ